MDSLIGAAARALAAGDALGALKCVALRDDPAALALRGIALAQLGELARARELLRGAARGFGAHEARARARCIVAEAEIALALRDLRGAPSVLVAAAERLAALGDHSNAQLAWLLVARRLLLVGRVADAAATLPRTAAPGQSPPVLAAMAALTEAEVALRTLRLETARDALARARAAAARSRATALVAEVAAAETALERPAARCIVAGRVCSVRLDQVAALLGSGALVVDACRRGLRAGAQWRSLTRRPLLLELLRALAESGPEGVDRQALILRLFRTRHPDESHRARLRVEVGRLRRLVAGLAQVRATPSGYALEAADGRAAIVIAPPIEGAAGAVVALLGDGAAWSTSALALALGASQRNVQRVLAALQRSGLVRSIGRGRARRWLAPPLAEFTTILLLPVVPPSA